MSLKKLIRFSAPSFLINGDFFMAEKVVKVDNKCSRFGAADRFFFMDSVESRTLDVKIFLVESDWNIKRFLIILT